MIIAEMWYLKNNSRVSVIVKSSRIEFNVALLATLVWSVTIYVLLWR